MNGKVARLLVCEIAVFGLHPLIGRFDIGIALWRAARRVTFVLDPRPEPLLDADGVALCLHFGGYA